MNGPDAAENPAAACTVGGVASPRGGYTKSRRLLLAAGILAALALPGCAGYTEFATDIGRSSATLNGGGTAGSGGTDVYFEYWPTGTPADRLETPRRSVGPGARGAFQATVAELQVDTSYSFRLCGREGTRVLCAQTRRFVTGADNVSAWGKTRQASPGETPYVWDRIDSQAFSGPTGLNPTGRFYNRLIVVSRPPPSTMGSLTEDNVTCVKVQGRTAVVGFKDPGASGEQNFALLEDNGPSGSGQDRYQALPNSFFNRQPIDCSLPLPEPLGRPETLAPGAGDVAISDNDPPPEL